MVNFKYANNFNQLNSDFDVLPEEPNLCALLGYDCCENCYFRLSTIERLNRGVEKLRARR